MPDLSRDNAARLSQAVEAACADLVPGSTDFSADTWTVLNGAVQAAARRFIQERNAARSPIARLPPELLRRVVSLLPLRDRLAASRVSRIWMGTLDNCFPVVVGADTLPTRLANLLRITASPVPGLVGVPLEFAARDAGPALQMILPHTHRVRRIRLMPLIVSDTLVSFLQSVAPELRHFTLHGLTPIYLHQGMEDGLFGGQAPKLHTCVLSNFSQGLYLLRTLTNLHTLAYCGVMSVAQLHTVLTNLVRLEWLSLLTTEWREGAGDVMRDACSPPQSLRTLSLGSWGLDVPSRALDHIDHSAISIIHISYRTGAVDGIVHSNPMVILQSHTADQLRWAGSQIVADVGTTALFALRAVDIYAADAQRVSVRVTASDGRRRVYSHVDRTALDELMARSAVGRATALTLNALKLFWSLDVSAVTELTLVNAHLHHVLPASHPVYTHTKVCPALRRLVLARTLPVARRPWPRWLAHFCATGIDGVPSGRLAELVLRGFSLSDEQRAVLEDVAEYVVLEDAVPMGVAPLADGASLFDS